MVAQCLAGLFGTPAVPTVGLVLGAAAAAAVATATSAGGTALATLQCWALYDGFALHRFGELHVAPADRRALAAVAVSAAAAHGIAALLRAERTSVRRAALHALRGVHPSAVPCTGRPAPARIRPRAVSRFVSSCSPARAARTGGRRRPGDRTHAPLRRRRSRLAP
jgi:hypothetical protein